MEEVGKLSRSLHFPPVEVMNDRSTINKLKIKNWLSDSKPVLEKILILLENNEQDPRLQAKCDEVVSVLILCGENHALAEWNDSEIVDRTNQCLCLLAKVLGLQAPIEVLHQKTITQTFFKELRTKLNKENIKKYPASMQCFIWAIKVLSAAELETVATNILPVCLVLLDDWEPEYQKEGLDCIHHILKENPKSLGDFGWHAVIYENLKKSTQLKEKYRVYECLDMCLKNQLPLRLKTKEWNKTDEYDKLVGEVLQAMMLDNSSTALSLHLEILLMLINSMQVKIASHLHPLLTNLEDRISETLSENNVSLICKVIDKIMDYCWPCFEERLCSHLAWLLYRLSAQTGANNNKTICHTKKSFSVILANVCPSLSDLIDS